MDRPDWDSLRRQVSGHVLLPADRKFGPARKSFIARFDDIVPQAIVAIGSTADAARAIGFARRHALPVAIRAGGHSAAGYSSTTGLLLDLSPLSSIEVANGLVTVGAGARTGHLSERLAAHGLIVPVGTCPSVGIGGLTLGGGFGNLGRKFGLTLDHLVSAQIVLGDGHILDCDERSEADLFWALRGAGCGNFGVVTTLTFEPRAIPPMTTFELAWPGERAAEVAGAWQAWTPAAPDELNAEMALNAPGDPAQPPSVEIYGVFLGSEREAGALIAGLQKAAGGADTVFCRELSYADTLRRQGVTSVTGAIQEKGHSGEIARQGYRVTKSEFFDHPLSEQVTAALVENWLDGERAGQYRSLEFAPWGGAYNRRPPQATAFVHRTPLFSIQHTALVDPSARAAAKEAAHDWVARSWACVHPHGTGRVYQNFPDSDLPGWAEAYHGENLPCLRELKSKYDPDNVFRFGQSLPGR